MLAALTGRALTVCAWLLFVSVALADGTTEYQTAVKLYRGISIIAASDPNHPTYRPGFTPEACELLREERWQAEAATRTTGTATYKCQVEQRAIVTFRSAPIQTCPTKPADIQEPRTCPTGTVGTWLQDRIYTLQPYPVCWVLGDWSPSAPPEGMCAPLESPTTIKINAGGPAISDYIADRYFANGTATSNCNRAYTGIFASRRYAPDVLRYRIPVANGQYTVRLLWRECWNSAAGQRVLSATIEGAQIAALDTYRPAGDVIAEERTVSVTDSAIDVAVTSVTGDAMINGIDVVAGGSGPVPTPEPIPTGTAALKWTPPTQNTDSTPAVIAGYRIHHGRSAGELTQTVQVANVSSYTLTGLASGAWFFSVSAYTSGGTQSAPSNIVVKVIL